MSIYQQTLDRLKYHGLHWSSVWWVGLPDGSQFCKPSEFEKQASVITYYDGQFVVVLSNTWLSYDRGVWQLHKFPSPNKESTGFNMGA